MVLASTRLDSSLKTPCCRSRIASKVVSERASEVSSDGVNRVRLQIHWCRDSLRFRRSPATTTVAVIESERPRNGLSMRDHFPLFRSSKQASKAIDQMMIELPVFGCSKFRGFGIRAENKHANHKLMSKQTQMHFSLQC